MYIYTNIYTYYLLVLSLAPYSRRGARRKLHPESHRLANNTSLDNSVTQTKYYSTLHYTTLHCTTLYYTTLCYTLCTIP